MKGCLQGKVWMGCTRTLKHLETLAVAGPFALLGAARATARRTVVARCPEAACKRWTSMTRVGTSSSKK